MYPPANRQGRRALWITALLALTCSAAAQAPASSAPVSREDQRFYATLAEAAKQVDQEKTKSVGGKNGGPFTEVRPEGGILVGFDVWTGPYGYTLIVKGIRPIYRTAAGEVHGGTYGTANGTPAATLEAKDGYAVAAIEARGGDRVDSFRVLFWKISKFDARLDADGSYKTDWVGGQGGAKAHHPLSSDGKPVIGITGASGTDLDRLGLIYAGGV